LFLHLLEDSQRHLPLLILLTGGNGRAVDHHIWQSQDRTKPAELGSLPTNMELLLDLTDSNGDLMEFHGGLMGFHGILWN